MARYQRRVEQLCEFQNYIESPPIHPEQMFSAACSSDGATMDAWRKIWIANVQANHERFGSFKARGIGQFFGRYKYKPAIVVGSGPSLKVNAGLLREKGDIPVVSCLHNFHFLEDEGVDVDFYVTLDAGEVVLEEVYEGGKRTPEEYWAASKGKKLLAFIGTSPKLFEKWQGEVYFFAAPVPDQTYVEAVNAVEEFHTYLSNGGNVLGACLYAAKGIMGANPIAFVGADFAFSYEKKFHGWDSKYDAKLGHVLKTTDVFGNKVLTWQSYHNFKNWFDWVACKVPGLYINCTEGGTFGAYPEGNIMAVRQMGLQEFLTMYHMHADLKDQCETPEQLDRKLLF